MRSEDLMALQAVAETGSITLAAERLGRSQPGLSRQLQRLAADVGAVLLRRRPHGVSLTPAGERLRAYAEERLAAEEALRAELHTADGELRGAVRIIASTIPSDYLLPSMIAGFTARHPTVRLEVTVGNSAQVQQVLLERRADVGFAGLHEPDARLTHVPVADDEIVLAVPAAHALARHATVPVAALEDQQLVWREDGSGTQRTFMRALARAGLALPPSSATASLGSTRAVIAAVEAGLGIGVVSQRAVPSGPGRGVVAVRLEGLPLRRRLWLLYETRRPRPAVQTAFLTFVTERTRADLDG
jgi:DNA-binding transcriptional LysR family regulator